MRLGLTKRDVSQMLKVKYGTLYTWTKDMKREKGRSGIRGKSLELLGMLVNRGYVLSKEVKHLAICMRTIGKYLPVRRIRIGRARVTTVWLLPGREREAMEAYLKLAGRHSIGYGKLGLIRRTFGVKSVGNKRQK